MKTTLARISLNANASQQAAWICEHISGAGCSLQSSRGRLELLILWRSLSSLASKAFVSKELITCRLMLQWQPWCRRSCSKGWRGPGNQCTQISQFSGISLAGPTARARKSHAIGHCQLAASHSTLPCGMRVCDLSISAKMSAMCLRIQNQALESSVHENEVIRLQLPDW